MTAGISGETVVRPSSHIAAADVDGEIVLLAVDSGRYHALDRTGSQVWALLDGRRPVERICSLMVRQYAVDRERCRRDVQAFLGSLLKEGAVEVVDA